MGNTITASATTVFDLGDRSTWPRSFDDAVTDIAAELEAVSPIETDECTSDLMSRPSVELAGRFDAQIREAMGGHQLIAHHATRLLAHEATAVVSEGLLVCSEQLAREKLIGAAREIGSDVMSDADIELLLRSGPFTWQGTKQARSNRVWVTSPFSIFETRGFDHLFAAWGGELVGWTDKEEAKAVIERVTCRSMPTIVDVTIGQANIHDSQISRVWAVGVGVAKQLGDAHHEWAVREPIPAARVVRLRTPADGDWPRGYGYLRSRW